MGCAPGTVKSLTSKALTAVRRVEGMQLPEEVADGPDIGDRLRRAAHDPGGDLDLAALRRRVRRLRRRRLAATVAVVALVALLVPLGQAGLERLREPVQVVDQPGGPKPAPAPTVTTRPASPAAPLRTTREVQSALSRLPPERPSGAPRPPGQGRLGLDRQSPVLLG